MTKHTFLKILKTRKIMLSNKPLMTAVAVSHRLRQPHACDRQTDQFRSQIRKFASKNSVLPRKLTFVTACVIKHKTITVKC